MTLIYNLVYVKHCICQAIYNGSVLGRTGVIRRHAEKGGANPTLNDIRQMNFKLTNPTPLKNPLAAPILSTR